MKREKEWKVLRREIKALLSCLHRADMTMIMKQQWSSIELVWTPEDVLLLYLFNSALGGGKVQVLAIRTKFHIPIFMPDISI